MFYAGDDGLLTYDLSYQDVVVSFTAVSSIKESNNEWKIKSYEYTLHLSNDKKLLEASSKCNYPLKDGFENFYKKYTKIVEQNQYQHQINMTFNLMEEEIKDFKDEELYVNISVEVQLEDEEYDTIESFSFIYNPAQIKTSDIKFVYNINGQQKYKYLFILTIVSVFFYMVYWCFKRNTKLRKQIQYDIQNIKEIKKSAESDINFSLSKNDEYQEFSPFEQETLKIETKY